MLSAANTFNAPLTLNAGTLSLGANGGVPANTALIVNTGATFALGGNDQLLKSLSGTGGEVAVGASALTINPSSDTTYPGVISGDGTVYKTGTGTQTFAGANTFTGTVNVLGGSLRVSAGGLPASSIALSGGTNLEYAYPNDLATSNSNIIGSGNLIKSGGSLVKLAGTNTYTGDTIVNDSGTLQVEHSNALPLNTRLTLNNNSNFSMGSTGQSHTLRTLSAGQGPTLVISAGSSLTFNPLLGDAPVYSGNINGFAETTVINKTGGGTQTLAGNASGFKGTLNVNDGRLEIGSGGSAGEIDSRSTVITSPGKLIFNRGDALTYKGTISGTGVLEKSGIGKLILTGQSNSFLGNTNVTAGELQIGNQMTTGALSTSAIHLAVGTILTFSPKEGTTVDHTGVISGAGSVVHEGNFVSSTSLGKTQLSAANTYTGGTLVKKGELVLNAVGGLPSGTPLTVNGGTFNLQNFSAEVSELSQTNPSTAGNVIVGNSSNSSATLTINTPLEASPVFIGSISGTGHLLKTGQGTQILANGAATNNAVRLVSIDQGRLQIGNGGSAGGLSASDGVSISSGARLVFNRSDDYSFSSSVMGAGKIEQAGSGVLTLSGLTATGADIDVTIGRVKLIPVSNGQSYGGAISGSVSSFLSVPVELSANVSTQNGFSLAITGKHTYQGSTLITDGSATSLIRLSGGSDRLPSDTSLIFDRLGHLECQGSQTFNSLRDEDMVGGNPDKRGRLTIRNGATVTINTLRDSSLEQDSSGNPLYTFRGFVSVETGGVNMSLVFRRDPSLSGVTPIHRFPNNVFRGVLDIGARTRVEMKRLTHIVNVAADGQLRINDSDDGGCFLNTRSDSGPSGVEFGDSSINLRGLSGMGSIALVSQNASGPLALTLKANAALVTYGGSFTGSGSVALNASNAGNVLQLTGSSTHTGGTTVTVGHLKLVGNLSSMLTIAPTSNATFSGPGTCSGGLNLGAGSNLEFTLGSSTDPLHVNGGLFSGPGAGTVNVHISSGTGFAAGTYTLIDFTGATTSDVNASKFTLASKPAGYQGTFSINAHRLQVTFTEQTGLEIFREANGLATDGSQDLGTPASDGVTNLLKYAFNMIGNGTGQAVSLSIPNVSAVVVNGSAGLPSVTRNASSPLEVTYIRHKSANSGITYTVQFSSDLIAWTDAASPALGSGTSVSTDYERVTVADGVFLGKRFARVKVRVQ